MIVFKFGPLSKDELAIRFDAKGAREFISAILHLFDGKNGEEVLDCFKRSSNFVDAARIKMKRDGQDSLEIKGNELLLCMSDDALEYAEFMLEKFLKEGDFSPSEFWEVSRKGRRYDTQVFFLNFSSFDS